MGNKAKYAAGAATGAASGAATGTAVLPGWGTAIGALAGAGLGAYGSYVQSQNEDDDYQMKLRAWKEDQDRQAFERTQGRGQQDMGNHLTAANYARGLQQNYTEPYAAYARMIGA